MFQPLGLSRAEEPQAAPTAASAGPPASAAQDPAPPQRLPSDATSTSLDASSDTGLDEQAARYAQLFEDALASLSHHDFKKAQDLLIQARALAPDDPDAALLLGIAYYRTKDYELALPLLRKASQSQDSELCASARLFLGRIYQAQGALDQARTELAAAGSSRRLADSVAGLTKDAEPHRISGMVAISPEWDGNVPLTPLDTWRASPAASMDGGILFVGALTLRPVRQVGLFLADSLSYRQQFVLQDYNLLLNATTLGYSYLGERHRLKLGLAFNYAMLGGMTDYLDYDGRAQYRVRLWSQLGLGLSYDGHYRDYRLPQYEMYTGQTHTLQAELNWGPHPEPVSVSLGYQVLREQLTPAYSAWGHGPLLRLRARPQRLVELALSASLIRRIFDPAASGRLDWYVSSDLSMTVTCTSWLDAFLGGTVLYNDSTSTPFAYFKPAAYAGVSAFFAAL